MLTSAEGGRRLVGESCLSEQIPPLGEGWTQVLVEKGVWCVGGYGGWLVCWG
jgi:hypothetical protein